MEVVLLGVLATAGAALLRFVWLRLGVDARSVALDEQARRRFGATDGWAVLDGARPHIHLERGDDGGWTLRIAWRGPVDEGMPDTATPWVYAAGTARGILPTPMGLRVRWTDPASDPRALGQELRQLWHRYVEPTAEELAHGVLHGPAHRRGRLLTAWHRRDPRAAAAFARTHVGPAVGLDVWELALVVGGVAAPAVAALSGPATPEVRCVAITFLGSRLDPDDLLRWAAVCAVEPVTALAFAKALRTHPTPERQAWLADLARRGTDGWPAEAAEELLQAHVDGVADTDEAELIAMLRAPRAVAERVVYRLRNQGTSAAIVAIRAREAYGAVSAEVARETIREITSRASPPGSVSLAAETGGAVSLAGDGGQLGLPEEEP
jgi:hypothetical protein